MSFKRLLTVGLMALFCAGTATAASQLNAVQVSSVTNAATVNLRTTGSYAHQEYRPNAHLMLVDLTGVTADPSLTARAATVDSAVLKGYKLTTYTSAAGSQVTRVELTLGDGVNANVSDQSDGLRIQLNGGAPAASASSALAAPSSPAPNSAPSPLTSPTAQPKPMPSSPVTPAHPTSAAATPTSHPALAPQPSPARPAEFKAVSTSSAAPALIRNISVSQGRGTLDIVIDGPSSARSFLLKSPDRLVLDFLNTSIKPSVKNIAVHTAQVREVRVGRFQSSPPVARVVIDLNGPYAFDVVPSEHQVIVRLKIGETGLPEPRSAAPVAQPNIAPSPSAVTVTTGSGSLGTTGSGSLGSNRQIAVPAPVTPPATGSKPAEAPAPSSAAKPVPAPRLVTPPPATPNVQSPATATATPNAAPSKTAQPVPAAAPANSLIVSRFTVPVTTTNDSPSAGSASSPAPTTPQPAAPAKAPSVVPTVVAPVVAPAAPAAAPPLAPPPTAPTTPTAATPAKPPMVATVVTPAVPSSATLPSPPPATPAAQSDITAAFKSPVVDDARLTMPSLQQSSATASSASSPASKYTGEPISVNLKDVDLKDFFRLIHEISGLNVVLDPSVHGSVTLVLDDVPWDQALDIVLKNNGLDRELQGNVLRIAASDTLRKEAVDRRAQSEAIALAVERQTVTRFLSYSKAKDLVPTVKKFLSARGDVISDDRTNALIISDIPSVLPALDRLISQLDKKSQQVEIEVRVVSATRSFSRDLGFQLGFNWGNGVSTIGGSNPNGSSLTSSSTSTTAAPPLFSNFPATGPTTGISFSNITKSYGLEAILTAAETHNLAKVLSRPRVVTQSNVKAEIKQGVKLPITTAATANALASTSYIDSVLRLSVTPQITADNTIFMTVDVENTQPEGEADSNGNFILSTQQTTTQVLVSDGGTVVIGGVIQTTNSVSTVQTPVLGNIPWLGNLFKERLVKTETDELIFFITPKIIQG